MSDASASMVVYVIGPADGPQKIGLGKRAESRLKNLQTGHPQRLAINFAMEVEPKEARAVETRAHFLLRKYRSTGEWFSTSPAQAEAAVREAVEAVRSRRGAPPADQSIMVTDMTAREFHATLRRLGWSQAAAARHLGTPYRTVQSWADAGPSGRPVPPAVARVLTLAERVPDAREWLEENARKCEPAEAS